MQAWPLGSLHAGIKMMSEGGLHNMKIGDAQKAYREQLGILRARRSDFVKQQKENREKMEAAAKNGDGAGVTLELSEEYLQREKELQEKIEELSGQIKKDEKGLEALIEQEVGIINSEVSKQQADAMQKYGEDMAKCLEIARRIGRGDRVPAQDEKKLMDFNMEIYQMAKNMAALHMDEEHRDWDSLWGKEEETEYGEPQEKAANAEAGVEPPEDIEAAAAETAE